MYNFQEYPTHIPTPIASVFDDTICSIFFKQSKSYCFISILSGSALVQDNRFKVRRGRKEGEGYTISILTGYHTIYDSSWLKCTVWMIWHKWLSYRLEALFIFAFFQPSVCQTLLVPYTLYIRLGRRRRLCCISPLLLYTYTYVRVLYFVRINKVYYI